MWFLTQNLFAWKFNFPLSYGEAPSLSCDNEGGLRLACRLNCCVAHMSHSDEFLTAFRGAKI